MQDRDFSVSFQVEVDHRLGLHEDFEDSNPIFLAFNYVKTYHAGVTGLQILEQLTSIWKECTEL